MYNEQGEHCVTDPRSVKVLWPDGPRWVSAEQVKSWAYDSWYNNADWYRCCACGQNAATELEHCIHDADAKPVHNDGAPEPRSLEEAMAWLADTGEMTFAKNQDVPADEDEQLEAQAYREATDDECDRREP